MKTAQEASPTSSRPRLILHVGAPKTGTTAIQGVLYRNRGPLLEGGILYPQAGTLGKGQAGHHNLVYEIAPSHRRLGKFSQQRGGWEEARREADREACPITVLSAEGLFRRARLVARSLKHFRGFDVTVAIYLRRQDQYLESGYNQLARFGRTLDDFETFVATHGKIVEYRRIISDWETHLPDATLVCVPFQSAFIGADVVADFSSRHLGGAALPGDSTANQRAGLKSVRAAQYIQKRGVAEVGPDFALTSKVAGQLRTMFTDRFDDVYDYSFCSADLAQEILARAEEDNRWLARRFPGFDPETFFDLPRRVESRRPSAEAAPFGEDEMSALQDFCDRLLSETRRARRASAASASA